ncbi:MAG: DUF58 domain-containing protein [Acidimicrobiia bacterium]|nr:DUF58 domain-containing protein [Acidimicrobiia bacterium]
MPTPAGWKLLGVGVAAVVGGRAFAIGELHVIGLTAAAAVVIALAVRLAHPSRLSIRRRVSSTMVAVSDPLDVQLEITNPARLPSPTVRISETVTGGGDVRCSVAPVPGGTGTTQSYRLQPARRGVLEIGPALLTDVDGLGLAHRRRITGSRTRVVVHPLIEQLAAPRLPVGGDLSLPIEFRGRPLGLSSEEFDVLRPYAEGDDLRHIHWRSTARLDEFTVRRFQPSRPGRLTVVVDTRPPGDRAAVQDGTTSVAASIVCAVLRNGDRARILTTDGRGTPMLSHRYDVGTALEFLAVLEGGRPTIDVDTKDGASIVVAVTASPEAIDDEGSRHGLAQRLGAWMVITHGAGHRGHTSPAADIEGGWIHLTGPGQLPGLWRLASMAGRRATAHP